MTDFRVSVVSTLHVFLSEPVIINQFIFDQWLKGLSVVDTAKLIMRTGNYDHRFFQAILSDTEDHYRNFQQLEQYLSDPTHFDKLNDSFQVPPSIRNIMLQKYFNFDEVVIRELLGKKLSIKLRKDLDDIEERTNISLQSCRRQFDNIRTVSKFITESPVENHHASMTTLIQQKYHISEELARKYATIIFIGYHRFDTSKRRLKDLNFQDFEAFTQAMMTHWTEPTNPFKLELDPVLINELRDIKSILHANKDMMIEYRMHIERNLKPLMPREKLDKLEEQKYLLKNLLTMSAELCQARELRDFFTDVIEKIGIKLKSAPDPLTQAEAQLFFDHLILAFNRLADTSKHLKNRFTHKKSWARFLHVVGACVIRLYPRLPKS